MTQDPNRALSAAIVAAGVSNKGLAKRVRDLSLRDGHPVSTDHVAIGRYLDGMQPKARTAFYITTALSEKLGRTLSSGELGFTTTDGSPSRTAVLPPNVRYPGNIGAATEHLGELARADAEPTMRPELGRWDTEAASSVITGYLFGGPGAIGGAQGYPDEPLDAVAIRTTTAHLMNLDFQLGGGHTRELLLFFFRSRVLPLLSSTAGRAPARRELFSATAELAQMLGWSGYDSGRHGAAQRYFVHGLRLAKEADDALLGARLLSNLSHQANYLGRYEQAVQLARAAQATTTRTPSATVSSLLLAMEARALASLGDAAGCASVLAKAERAFERRNAGSDPPWIGYFNRAELAGESAHCFRDLRRSDETAQFAVLAVEPGETPARTLAFINMVSAMSALTADRLDEAVATTWTAVEIAGPLQSSRYRRYVKDFLRTAVELHPRDARVKDLSEFVTRRFEIRVGA